MMKVVWVVTKTWSNFGSETSSVVKAFTSEEAAEKFAKEMNEKGFSFTFEVSEVEVEWSKIIPEKHWVVRVRFVTGSLAKIDQNIYEVG